VKLLELYRDKVWGAISGLDRIRFRGTWRWLANESGTKAFLSCFNILLKDYPQWVAKITDQVRDSCQKQAKRLGIEIRYLPSSLEVKEDLARQIAEAHGIEQGPICLLSVVEPCVAPSVKGNRDSKQLELKMSRRKCVWLYYYFNDPQLGFGHLRLQTWLPLTVFVCLNGRHWL